MELEQYASLAKFLSASGATLGAGTLISLLLTVNGYFIKKLVEKIGDTFKKQEEMSVHFSQLNTSLNTLKHEMTELRSELKDLRKLETDVALIKFMLTQKGFQFPERRDPVEQ